MYTTSAGALPTGSLDHGVSWFYCALIEYVLPTPSVETRNPNSGFAMTLLHGAGVHSRSLSTVTYSRPLAAKPPRPLKSSSGGTLRIASNEGSALLASRGRGLRGGAPRLASWAPNASPERARK